MCSSQHYLIYLVYLLMTEIKDLGLGIPVHDMLIDILLYIMSLFW